MKLNENEDIDYSLCDLVVILSSTFFTKETNSKSGKKYVNDYQKYFNNQSQRFWAGLTKLELNGEIQQQKKEIDTLDEITISEEKINNNFTAKLMSVSIILWNLLWIWRLLI